MLKLFVCFVEVYLSRKLPVHLAIAGTRTVNEKDNKLKKVTILSVDVVCLLLLLCFSSTHFSFKGVHFNQTSGTTMGASVSVTIANLTMEDSEQRALQSFFSSPRGFLHYEDDCFCILKEPSQLYSFLAHLNSIKPAFQFAVKCDNNNTLPFLDQKKKYEVKFFLYRGSQRTEDFTFNLTQTIRRVTKHR